MKIVFFGSDDFSAASFMRIQESRHEVIACVTQPDRMRGRGMKVQQSPIKELAIEYDLPVLQPDDVSTAGFVDALRMFDADVFVVVAYGQILPQTVLDLPQRFCINVHGSLLPRYRGAAPINWAVIHGDKETGVTIQKMAIQMDAGDILCQAVVPIKSHQDAEGLRTVLSATGAETVVKALDLIENDQYTLTPQKESEVTYAPKLEKSMGYIHWDKEAEYIARLVRGLKPWPGTFTFFTGLRLKILEATVVDMSVKGYRPGVIMEKRKNGFVVATGKKGLLVKHVHMESSKPANAGVFLSSYTLPDGFCLG